MNRDGDASDRIREHRERKETLELLITVRGTQTLSNGFGGLLDCARNSSDEEDFNNQIALPGYLTQKARDYSGVIKSIIEQLEPGGHVPSSGVRVRHPVDVV